MSLFVGLEEILVEDKLLNQTFPMLVMYPTDTSAVSTKLGPYTLDVAPNAKIKDGQFPLVMISHGTGGSNQTHRMLAAYLAKNDFIVCIPEHPFNNRNNNERADTIENLTDRPKHIKAGMDFIFSDVKWSQHVQSDNAAVIGHSLGGYTALALVGGIPHTQHQIKYDPQTKITRPEQIEVSIDERIKAVVLLAPAAGWYLSEGALSAVKVPILLFSAGLDQITPLFHADIIKKGVVDSTQVIHRIIEGAGHFSFLSPFPQSMKAAGLPPAQDPAGFDREKFHQAMNEEILEFLSRESSFQKR